MTVHNPLTAVPPLGGRTAGAPSPANSGASAEPIHPAVAIGVQAEQDHAHSTGEASAPNLSTVSKVTCGDCSGSGEAMFLALDGVREEVGYCEPCDGTGLVEPVCGVCEGTLNSTSLCPDCDYPSGWLLAERSAYLMGVRS